MKVGIRFGDNDFVNAIRMWSYLFLQGVLTNLGSKRFEKADVVDLFNDHAWRCHVWTKWNEITDLRDPTNITKTEANGIRDYLQITEDNVYFDEEIDEYLEEQPDDIYYTDGNNFYSYGIEAPPIP